jgi:hypothetical protein
VYAASVVEAGGTTWRWSDWATPGRTPVDVLTDATWGAFQAGWRGPVGADADHLKTTSNGSAPRLGSHKLPDS